ncbi:MAG: hypothetical protein AABY01_04120 [Nanoarchaeota archaeon]
MDHKEALTIIAAGFIASFVPALLTGSLTAAFTFAFGFTLLFVVPLVPWMLQLQIETFERIVLAMILGVAAVPIGYFIIGVVHGPLTLLVMLAVPAIIFGVGIWRLLKKKA